MSFVGLYMNTMIVEHIWANMEESFSISVFLRYNILTPVE